MDKWKWHKAEFERLTERWRELRTRAEQAREEADKAAEEMSRFGQWFLERLEEERLKERDIFSAGK
jgi:hypothetical protein